MMGMLPLQVLTGCLNALRWMLWAVALLLCLLLITQKLRGDADIRPAAELIAIVAFMLAGKLTGWISARVRNAGAQVAQQAAAQASGAQVSGSMADVRREIDKLDEQLVALLARRQRQIERAAAVKPGLGIPARVPERIDIVLDHVVELAGREGLDQNLARHIWSELIEWSIALEEKLIGERGRPDQPALDS